MEVVPGIHQLRIPVPGSQPGYLNAYLIKSEGDCMLVDTGWDTDEAYAALAGQLGSAGAQFAGLKYITITHVHPDHYGLVGRLRAETPATLVIHELERSFLRPRYLDYHTLLREMDEWLRANGVAEEARPALEGASLPVLGLVSVAMPDYVVTGGEHLRVGSLDFEVVWTPGHSRGHICLYEPALRVLISGDHVLPDTTPNISMHIQSSGNPLQDYLDALDRVAALPVNLVLPSHGDVFTDLAGRVVQIKAHHEGRIRAMLAAFDGSPHTASDIAAAIPWTGRDIAWAQLPPLHRRMAVTETLSHLELMQSRGLLHKYISEGLIWYAPA
jgi:glyoxylase-like metal-dependent hydrolase (beta-lactamase superfamily II)